MSVTGPNQALTVEPVLLASVITPTPVSRPGVSPNTAWKSAAMSRRESSQRFRPWAPDSTTSLRMRVGAGHHGPHGLVRFPDAHQGDVGQGLTRDQSGQLEQQVIARDPNLAAVYLKGEDGAHHGIVFGFPGRCRDRVQRRHRPGEPQLAGLRVDQQSGELVSSGQNHPRS